MIMEIHQKTKIVNNSVSEFLKITQALIKLQLNFPNFFSGNFNFKILHNVLIKSGKIFIWILCDFILCVSEYAKHHGGKCFYCLVYFIKHDFHY